MRGVTRQPARLVRVACPRFPAPMRDAVVWRRGVRSYDDLMRAYVERGLPPVLIDSVVPRSPTPHGTPESGT